MEGTREKLAQAATPEQRDQLQREAEAVYLSRPQGEGVAVSQCANSAIRGVRGYAIAGGLVALLGVTTLAIPFFLSPEHRDLALIACGSLAAGGAVVGIGLGGRSLSLWRTARSEQADDVEDEDYEPPTAGSGIFQPEVDTEEDDDDLPALFEQISDECGFRKQEFPNPFQPDSAKDH